MSDARYLFVYGTLKRGERNHCLLDGQPFVREVTTAPVYRLHDCGPYPALVEVATDGRSIRGEVYLVHDSAFGQLDALEDAPRLYRLTPAQLLDCELTVWTYVYQQDVSRFRDCGDSWTGERGRVSAP